MMVHALVGSSSNWRESSSAIDLVGSRTRVAHARLRLPRTLYQRIAQLAVPVPPLLATTWRVPWSFLETLLSESNVATGGIGIHILASRLQ